MLQNSQYNEESLAEIKKIKLDSLLSQISTMINSSSTKEVTAEIINGQSYPHLVEADITEEREAIARQGLN